jgi:hypothetical protein
MRFIISLLLAVALAGCASRSSVDDGQQLQAGEGFIALRIDSNTAGNIWYTEYSKDRNFASRFGDAMVGGRGGVQIVNGQRYWLLNRPAGEYMWYEFNSGNAVARMREGANRFRITPGAITYVGHVEVNRSGSRLRLRVRDDEADMRAHLEATYPGIYKAHRFEKQIAEFGL